MKKVLFKSVMVAVLAGTIPTACVDVEDKYDPNALIQQQQQQYNQSWTDSFGAIDPGQTWNTARQVSVDMHLQGIASGVSNVNIYTARPGNPSCVRLASKNLSGNASISFDMPKALNYIYVTVSNMPTLNGYYEIRQDKAVVALNNAFTRADESCNVTLGPTIEMGTFHSYDTNANEPYQGKLYSLNGVTKTNAKAWRFLDYLPLYGKDGVFPEGRDNLTPLSSPESDIIYTTTEAGPVEISYIFGSTSPKNQMGYFYYNEGATIEEICNADKYLLLSDARPTSSISVSGLQNGFSYTEDYHLGNWFLYNVYEENGVSVFNGGDPWVTGSTYKLVYFDEHGNASYDFPAGLNIGFFIISDGMSKTSEVGDYIYYSMPSVNRETGKAYQADGGTWDNPNYKGLVKAVTYKYGDDVLLGFEDQADNDMNDMLFRIGGNLTTDDDIEDVPVEEPKDQEWILACEDLGAIGDFDFNDVVFSIQHASGSGKAKVTPLAAGGTLPIYIRYNGNQIGSEVHEMFGKPVNEMVNTQTGRYEATAQSVEIDVNADLTMSSGNMGGFSILVQGISGGQAEAVVAAPTAGSAPQMICVPTGWAWPKERESIVNSYKGFGEWGANYQTSTDWYENPTGKTIDGDYTAKSYTEVVPEIPPVSDYGTNVNAVSGQPISADYFANVGATCTLILVEANGFNGVLKKFGEWVECQDVNGYVDGGVVEITLKAELLPVAKEGKLEFCGYSGNYPAIYIK